MEYDVLEGFWGDAGESIDAYYAVNDFVRRERREQAVIDGLKRLPLQVLRPTSAAGSSRSGARASCPQPDASRRTSPSRARGVIRGLHFHERGQDDLFACLTGMARVVVLDRESGEIYTEDIGEENPVAIYVPGRARPRVRGAHRSPLLLPRHPRVRPGRARRARRPVGRPARQAPLEHAIADPVRAGHDVLVTGAGGQLGHRPGRGVPGRRRARPGGARRDAADRASLPARRSSSTRPRGRTSTAPSPIRPGPER